MSNASASKSLLIGIDASRAARARRTGTERYNLEIICHLLALPVEHRFRLYFNAPPPAELLAQFPSVGERMEIVVLPGRRIWTHRTLAHEVVQRPPDVLFVPSHVLPLRLPVHRLPPMVVTIHDLGYLYYPETHARLQRWYLRWSTRWSAAVADRIIAVSQATAADIQEHMPAATSKITVIHEALVAWTAPPTAAAAVRARYDLRRPYALYVGTIQPRKNIERLLQAYALLLKGEDVAWDLVLAGGAGWLSTRLLQRVAELGIAGRVHFLGYTPESDLPALFAGATFFCYPSLYEGFGLPVLEAQKMGVPVMTSSGSSLPEVAGDAALLVDPTNVEAIADAMLRLSQDEALRQQLIAAGHANVARFSWEKAALETLTVLEEAAGSRGGKRA
jgi:glycosyltransferase involved in cell wall biosynthesis